MGTLKWLTVVRLEDKLLFQSQCRRQGSQLAERDCCIPGVHEFNPSTWDLERGRGMLITGFELAWST